MPQNRLRNRALAVVLWVVLGTTVLLVFKTDPDRKFCCGDEPVDHSPVDYAFDQ